MKYIITNEEYAYERNLKRRKKVFDNLDPIVKKRKYDANFLLKKLIKDYPSIKNDISI